VVGIDENSETIEGLNGGRAPLMEPGLDALLKEGLNAGRLSFSSDRAASVKGASVLWVTFDTPVDEADQADVQFVTSKIATALDELDPNTLVIVSSQLPVGSIRTLEGGTARGDISFACLPENLRLGKAIDVFTNPDRVVAGVRNERDQQLVRTLLEPITTRIEWMSVESAEMTKHAVNAFLALSVSFINELATLCEHTGADAKEVERGLKSEARIGPKAYLSPGGAFAGGTLARDISFLTKLGKQAGLVPPLIASVHTSNDLHKGWPRRKLEAVLGSLEGRTVAVWGLTYKVGTDTLRRSSAIELCSWLHAQGARVQGHDPAVKKLPSELEPILELQESATKATDGADALVVETQWPDYREIDLNPPARLIVLDTNRFLAATLENKPMIDYYTVGKGAQ
jgi:UDPglucose 6-dehydrogenase